MEQYSSQRRLLPIWFYLLKHNILIPNSPYYVTTEYIRLFGENAIICKYIAHIRPISAENYLILHLNVSLDETRGL